MALDLLAQRPNRPRPGAPHPAAPRRVAGPARQVRPDRSGTGQLRPGRDRLGAGPRERGWLDVPADHRRVHRWKRPAGRVRRVGAAYRASDAPNALLRQPDVRAGQRFELVHVLRDVRIYLLHRAVLPDRAGAVAVSVRATDPAVDGDADVRRTGRRRAL